MEPDDLDPTPASSEGRAGPQDPTGAPEAMSVLDALARTTGDVSRISLPDADSRHGASPVLGPNPLERRTLARGRGSYQLLGEIARGGMGTILRGHDYDLGRDVAIKVLDEELARKPHVMQRFIEEAQIGGQLQHPGVVPVYEMGLMSEERPFFAMKLVKGRTLSALLAKRKSLDEDRRTFLSIFEGVCQTVAYAHSKGVVHRDLKPANVMVGAFGEVQVVDWGLAKVLSRGGIADEKRSQPVQQTVIETVRSGPGSGSDSLAGSVMGTPAYMPPEQARGEVDTLDERTDVFALGAILCEILCGRPPYVAEDGENIVVQAAGARLGPARKRLEECKADAELVRLCLECMAPAPQARPSNAEEVAKAIHRYSSESEARARAAQLEATEARIRAVQERKARRLTVALAFAIVLLLTTLGGGKLWLDARERTRLAEVRRQVDDSHQAALRLQAEGRWEAALTEARDAARLADTGGGDEELVAMTAGFVERAEASAREARERAELEARNERLLARLDAATEEQEALSDEEIDAAYREAFLDYGLDLEADDLGPVVDVLRERGMGELLALRLDEWGRLKRRMEGWDAPAVVGLTAVAADLDPDPSRIELREALMERDAERLRSFATPENVRQLPAATVLVLCGALSEIRVTRDIPRLLSEAARAHPDDFRLQVETGRTIRNLGPTTYLSPPFARHALEHLRVAEGLRPEDLYVKQLIADTCFSTGDYVRSLAYNDQVAEQTGRVDVLRDIAVLELVLGRWEDSLRTYERAQAAGSLSESSLIEYDVARVCNGSLSMDELAARVEAIEGSSYVRQLLAWVLLFQPDTSQRDPERALAICGPLEPPDHMMFVQYELRVTANHRLGRHEEVVALLDDIPIFDIRLASAVSIASLGALSFSELGDDAQARTWFRIARDLFEQLTGGDENPWEGSEYYANYRRAKARLGR